MIRDQLLGHDSPLTRGLWLWICTITPWQHAGAECHPLTPFSYMSGLCPGGLAWQDFYGVYVHARPSYRFPATSFFCSFVIEDRINVAWGSWDIVSPCCSQ